MAFEGKVVLITGAGGGIGAAIALKFARLGAQLALVDRNQSALKQTLERCDQPHLTIVADLADPAQLDSVIPTTIKKFGKLDVLVNCAGTISMEPIGKGEIQENYDSVMPINLRAPMVLTDQAAPYLIQSKGNVVNMCSLNSHFAVGYFPIYCVGKAGLEMFTKCVALELSKHGVRANCVLPSGVRTDLFKQAFQKLGQIEQAAIATQNPGKLIEPEEVAALVVYLANDECARSITGASYAIDCGYSIALQYGSLPQQIK